MRKELLAATISHGNLNTTLQGHFCPLYYKNVCIDSGDSRQHNDVCLDVINTCKWRQAMPFISIGSLCIYILWSLECNFKKIFVKLNSNIMLFVLSDLHFSVKMTARRLWIYRGKTPNSSDLLVVFIVQVVHVQHPNTIPTPGRYGRGSQNLRN